MLIITQCITQPALNQRLFLYKNFSRFLPASCDRCLECVLWRILSNRLDLLGTKINRFFTNCSIADARTMYPYSWQIMRRTLLVFPPGIKGVRYIIFAQMNCVQLFCYDVIIYMHAYILICLRSSFIRSVSFVNFLPLPSSYKNLKSISCSTTRRRVDNVQDEYCQHGGSEFTSLLYMTVHPVPCCLMRT